MILWLGPCRLDLAARRAERGGHELKLSTKEWELLEYLSAHAGRDVSMEELHREVWTHHSRVSSRAAFHTMQRLRKKLEQDPGDPQYLLTVYGMGYRLTPGEPPSAPRAPAPLLGRELELARLLELLAQPVVVTLKGIGGLGKTRLGEAALERVRAMGLEGYLVGTSGLRSEAELASAIALALQIPPSAQGMALEAQLSAVIRSRGPLLLVLDAFEGALAAAPLVARVRAAAPRAQILVTSTVPLGLRGEVVMELEPLPLQAAVTLLRERAARKDRPLGEVSGLPELAEALDRLPLALELVAPRLAVATPAALLGRLEELLDQLASTEPDRPLRHRSLRAALASSLDALEPRVLRALAEWSVFVGPFRAEDAAAVSSEPGAAWELLEELLDRSLLVRRTTQGAPELHWLDAVRWYASERLDELGAEARSRAERAHAAWFARCSITDGRLVRLLPHLHAACRRAIAWGEGTLAVELLERIAIAAQHSGVAQHEALADEVLTLPLSREDAVRTELAACLMRMSRGRLAESSARAGGLVLDGLPDRLVQKTHLFLAKLHLVGGELERARRALERAEGLLGENEELELARGLLLLREGHMREALATLERPFRGVRRLTALVGCGQALHQLSRHIEARDVLQEAVTYAQSLGHSAGELTARGNLALVDLAMGNLAAARGELERQIRTSVERDDPRAEASLRANMGNLLHELGELDAAEAEAARATVAARRAGCHHERVQFLNGLLKIARGKLDEAAALLEGLQQDTVDSWYRGSAAVNLAGIELARGNLDRSGHWLALAERWNIEGGGRLESVLAKIRADLAKLR